MKAHDLAKQLLKLPDYEVVVCGNTECLPEGNFQADIEEPCANAMQNEDGSVEMVVIFDLKGDK